MSILKKMNFLISAFPLILGSVLGLSGTDKLWAQSTSEPIKVGVILSLTGAAAGLGVPERNGILLAEKTINAKGGVGGRQIKFIVEDDTSNPDTALFKANDLVFSQKVAVGHLSMFKTVTSFQGIFGTGFKPSRRDTAKGSKPQQRAAKPKQPPAPRRRWRESISPISCSLLLLSFFSLGI